MKTVQRTENSNEEAESQEVQPSSLREPLNPGAWAYELLNPGAWDIQGQDKGKKGKASFWRVLQE